MPLRVIRFDDVDSFLERAEGWLRQAEAENNLILGVAHQVRRGDHPFEEPIYLAAVVENESIVTCAFRTPPFKLGLTRAPESAIPRLVRDVREVYGSLPGVLGPEPAAVQFADLWTLEFGGEWERGMRQGIYALEEVISPSKPAPGGLRLATDADLPLVLDWAEAMIRFAGVPAGSLERLTRSLVRSESMFFWEDGEPRSMAGVTGNTPNGARIAFVYTPEELRGRGYASSCVAALSQRMLDQGRRFCFLYADLSNPTSNSIYQRIGYRHVRDALEIRFI